MSDELQPGDHVKIELVNPNAPESKVYKIIHLGPFVARIESDTGRQFSANRGVLRQHTPENEES